MKAATLSNKPDFNLMKQTDIQAFYHLQMPRWLFFDSKYMSLSLEAKVTYTFLLNRFQLSKFNNWINEDGAVFLIYTRESLSKEMQISYRRVIDCMKELAAANLIWERRCGRGDANQIYLAQVELSNEQALVYSSTPFVSKSDEAVRPAETACLGDGSDVDEPDGTDNSADLRPVEIGYQVLQASHLLMCDNGTSGPAEFVCQDLQNPHSSYIDIENKDKSDTEKSNTEIKCAQSLSASHAHGSVPLHPKSLTARDGSDTDELDKILANCDLWTFEPETAAVFENAIERLFFSENYRIGNAVLPRSKVRSHLQALNQLKLKCAEDKISQNTERKIKNTTAYTMAVIFNSIWETESDIMADPYLNSLKLSADRDSPPALSGRRWDK